MRPHERAKRWGRGVIWACGHARNLALAKRGKRPTSAFRSPMGASLPCYASSMTSCATTILAKGRTTGQGHVRHTQSSPDAPRRRSRLRATAEYRVRTCARRRALGPGDIVVGLPVARRRTHSLIPLLRRRAASRSPSQDSDRGGDRSPWCEPERACGLRCRYRCAGSSAHDQAPQSPSDSGASPHDILLRDHADDERLHRAFQKRHGPAKNHSGPVCQGGYRRVHGEARRGGCRPPPA